MPKKNNKAEPKGAGGDDLKEKLLVHTDMHDLADMPDLEDAGSAGHGHAHGHGHGHSHVGEPCTAHGHAAEEPAAGHSHGEVAAHGHGHSHDHGHGDEVPPTPGMPRGWKRRKDLDGDLGAGWRLRAASKKSARKFFCMLVLSFSYLYEPSNC